MRRARKRTRQADESSEGCSSTMPRCAPRRFADPDPREAHVSRRHVLADRLDADRGLRRAARARRAPARRAAARDRFPAADRHASERVTHHARARRGPRPCRRGGVPAERRGRRGRHHRRSAGRCHPRHADAAPAPAAGDLPPRGHVRCRVDRPGCGDRGQAAIPVAGQSPRRRAALHAEGVRAQAHRSARAAQAQHLPLAPHRGPGLAHRDQEVPEAHRGRRVAEGDA